jgi:hypothetical protein
VSPQRENGWLSAWFPQLPGRIENRFAYATGAISATSAHEQIAARATRTRMFIKYLSSSVWLTCGEPEIKRLAAELSHE